MIVEITGVQRNAAHPPGTVEPLVPYPQEICLPRGEQLVIKLTVQGQDYQPVDISAGSIVLVCRARRLDEDAEFKATASIDNGPSGLATITVPGSETIALSEQFGYLYDVQWTDGNSVGWQLVPASRLRIEGIVGRSTD